MVGLRTYPKWEELTCTLLNFLRICIKQPILSACTGSTHESWHSFVLPAVRSELNLPAPDRSLLPGGSGRLRRQRARRPSLPTLLGCERLGGRLLSPSTARRGLARLRRGSSLPRASPPARRSGRPQGSRVCGGSRPPPACVSSDERLRLRLRWLGPRSREPPPRRPACPPPTGSW